MIIIMNVDHSQKAKLTAFPPETGPALADQYVLRRENFPLESFRCWGTNKVKLLLVSCDIRGSEHSHLWNVPDDVLHAFHDAVVLSGRVRSTY